LACSRNGSELPRFPELARAAAVLCLNPFPGATMDKKQDDKVIPCAKGKQTPQADFDRNRDGLYGGLPKARDSQASGPAAKQPHPPR
jgi:hypothetical protein